MEAVRKSPSGIVSHREKGYSDTLDHQGSADGGTIVGRRWDGLFLGLQSPTADRKWGGTHDILSTVCPFAQELVDSTRMSRLRSKQTIPIVTLVVRALQGYWPQKKLRHQMWPPGSSEWPMLEALVGFGGSQKELVQFCLVSSLWGVF